MFNFLIVVDDINAPDIKFLANLDTREDLYLNFENTNFQTSLDTLAKIANVSLPDLEIYFNFMSESYRRGLYFKLMTCLIHNLDYCNLEIFKSKDQYLRYGFEKLSQIIMRPKMGKIFNVIEEIINEINIQFQDESDKMRKDKSYFPMAYCVYKVKGYIDLFFKRLIKLMEE